MKISCGIIITDGDVILLGHVTGYNHWDVPKGGVDPGENFYETAVRELKEETGVELKIEDIEPLGRFKYRTGKDVVLFLYLSDQLPPISKMECTSYFLKNKVPTLEIDGFKYVKISDMDNFIRPKLSNVVKRALGII